MKKSGVKCFSKEDSLRIAVLTPEQLLAQHMEERGVRKATAAWICGCGVGNHEHEKKCFTCKEKRN